MPRWWRRSVLAADARFLPVARVERGGLVESWHLGAAAVALPGGRLMAHLADPDVETFLRSAAKPFQVLPLLLAGGAERFALEPADLALICASHSGSTGHVERVEALLARGEFTAGDLRCGSHPPLDETAARVLARAGREPTALHNNCSGKHAGMLLACRLLGLEHRSYLAAEHPLQQRILDHVAELCGVAPAAVGLAIDGCSVPTFRMSLAAAARGYAALGQPRAADLSEEIAQAIDQVVAAMAAAPEMVAGAGRFTTRLIEVTRGRILGKEGAEGFYGIVIRGPVALGAAVKIADGAGRCRDGVVIDLLCQLGVLSGAEYAELEAFRRVPVRNHRGLVVGEIVPEVELVEAGGAAEGC